MQENFFSSLQTEHINENTTNIDALSTKDMVGLMIDAEKAVDEAIKSASDKIILAVDKIVECFRKGGRLIYAGAGTSGRLGVLDASECPPTFGVDESMVVGLIAGGDIALRKAVEGAEDDYDAGRKALCMLNPSDKDFVLAISASGYAPWCIGVLDEAKGSGAFAASLVCVEKSLLSEHSELCIELVTGAEVLSGSTRLKAGTATKRALNMLSTLSMIQMGKVYQNLMVDVKASNNKLFDRAIRIVSKACNLSREKSETLLKSADMNAKLAIIMGILDTDKKTAQELLLEGNGFVRKALEIAKMDN